MDDNFALWLTVMMFSVMTVSVTFILTNRIVELRHRVNKLEIYRRLDEGWINETENGFSDAKKRKLIMLNKEECADIWADAHDIEGRMIWTPAQLFDQIMNRIKEKNLG